MDPIKTRWPRIYKAFQNTEPASWTVAARGKTIRLIDLDRKAVTLCSPRNPDSEARSAIKAQAGQFPPSPLVLIGVGVGHRIKAALEMTPADGRVVAVILNRPAFLSGIKENLLSEALRDERLELVLGDQKGIVELSRILDEPKGAVVIHGPAMRVAEDFAADAVRLAQNISTYGHASSKLMHAIRDNYRANLKHLCMDTPLRVLRNLAQGMPVAIVGAGPSLESAAKELGNYRNKLFVICVEAAIAPLHRMGLSADLAVSVDPFKHNARQCRTLPEYPPLVYMPSVHPEVPENWENTRIVALPKGDRLAEAMDRELGVGLLNSGGIVGTAAMALADYLGGNPLILVGMDLAFTHDKSHAFRRDKAVEAKESPYLTKVAAIGGGTVLTNATFKRAIAWFELFANGRPPGSCIDAGAAGALKQGYALMGLGEAILNEVEMKVPLIPPCRPLALDNEKIQRLFNEFESKFA